MSNEVKTPEYWKDEFFQPLVKAKTINGNEVMIPKIFTAGWHGIEIQAKELLKIMPVEKIVRDFSPEKISFRRIISRDYLRVYFEILKENSPKEMQIIEAYLKE